MAISKTAIAAFRALNGVACIYKPSGINVRFVQKAILNNLCRELNDLHVNRLGSRVEITGPTNGPMEVEIKPNYADHHLVIGPMYKADIFRSNYATHLSRNTSGVMMMGINSGTKQAINLNLARLTRAYKVHGILGKATSTFFKHGRVAEKATYKHVTADKMDRVVRYMQMMHQRKMYEMSGLDMQSQAAYELAVQGPMRPASKDLPILYGIKCVYFNPPDFIIEVQSVNEYEKYLHTLIHDIGMQLHTCAHCTLVQCIRHGKFTIEHALLKKHWTLNHVIDSIKTVEEIFDKNEDLLMPQSAILS